MASQDPQRDDYLPTESSRRRLHLREVRSDTGDYDGIGVELRAARTRVGVDIADIAQKLRISPAYLEAIEKGQFDALPGHVYVIGFLKSYARFLALDESIVVDRFRAETTGPRRESRLAFPSAMDRGRMPTGRLLLGGVLLAVLAYAGWFVFTSEERSTAERVAPIPERLVETTEAPATRLTPPVAEESAVLQPNSDAVDPLPTSEATPPFASPESASPVVEIEPPLSPLVVVEGAPQAPATATTEISNEVAVANDNGSETTAIPADAGGSASAAEETPVVAPISRAVQTLAPPPGLPEQRVDAVATNAPPTPSPVVAGSPPSVSPGDIEIRRLADASSAPIAAVSSTPSAASNTPPTPREAVGDGSGEADVAVRGPEATPPPLAAQIDEARSPGDGGYVPRVFGAGNENARVVLVAENDSWVQVRATSGELLLTRVLRPGDRYLVPDRPGLLLMTGNLGALEVIVDGVPIPRLGPVGVIGRDISLAVDDLRNRRGPVEAGTGGTQTDP